MTLDQEIGVYSSTVLTTQANVSRIARRESTDRANMVKLDLVR